MSLTSLRRLLFPVGLARARLGSGGERLALVTIGIVAGSAALAAVLCGRLVMQDRALAQATAALAPGDRSVEVAWFGSFGGTWRSLDREVAASLERMTGRSPVRAMLYRESQIDGRLVNLRAANGLPPFVRLLSGRLPRPCVPSRCEVLRLAGPGPVPSKSTLRLIQVGRAELLPAAPFGPFVQPALGQSEQVARALRYHTPQPSPVLLADGVDGLSRTTELESFFRSYAWFVPVEARDVHPWSVGSYAHRVDLLRAELGSRSDRFEVTAPTDELGAAVASSRVAARRLLLLGGEAGALLLAFTILAAASLRRDVADVRRRLLWAGARRWQVELHTFAETGAVAIAGTAAGWGIGAAIGAVVAATAGSPAGPVVGHALLSGGGVATAAGSAAAAGVLLYLTVRAPAAVQARLRLTPLDVAALAAAAVVAVGYGRGAVDARSLGAGRGTGTFVLLVPALVTFASAVLAARLLVPILRALGRIGRRGPLSLRLAAVSLARSPGGATVVATFLVASLGLALFAVTYRSTLLRGQQDEAAYAAPAPYVADEDLSQLVPALHGWGGAPATQILRLSGNVPSSASFGFLGIPASAVAATGGWRADFSSRPLARLGEAIRPSSSTALVTGALPAGRTFVLPASITGDDIVVRAIFRSPLGDFRSVNLGVTGGSTTVPLHGRVPYPGARLAALELTLDNSGRSSANAGTGTQPTAHGTLRLGTPSVDGRRLPGGFDGWIGVSGAARRGGAGVRLAYSLTVDEATRFRPRQPTDGMVLPILATPGVADTAGPDGTVLLTVEGDEIPARVVGVIDRFPSVVGEAVIADRVTAQTMLDTRSPGLGTTNELWARSLPTPPPASLTIVSRASILAGLRSDPLARGALTTLAATAAVALALALVGLLLGVVGDRRDERGELFDLEAQGASPATIRGQLRLRALLVAAFGLLGGIATGAVLSALVLSLVSVTASSARPEPPLRLVLDLRLLLGAVGIYAVAAALLVTVATRAAGPAPERSAEVAA